MSPATLSVIRTLLAFGGGLLVAKGWLTSDQLSSLINDLLVAVGALAPLVALALSLWRNHQNKQAQAVAAVIGAPVKVEALKVPTVANAVPSATAVADMAKAQAPALKP